MKPTIHSVRTLTVLCTLGVAACGGENEPRSQAVDRPMNTTSSALTSCDGTETTEFMVVDSDITGEEHWSGTVYVEGSVKAATAAVLTIEPGTQIVMAQNSELDFAANADAKLLARGAATAPVQFCGEEAEAGYWAGLKLGAASETSLEHVQIVDAGAEGSAALILSAAAKLDNVSISGSAGDGVHAVDFSSDSAELSVEGSAETAVVLKSDMALAHFPASVTLEGNGENRVRLSFAEIDMDTTLEADVDYVQEGTLSVSNGAVFTLQAGVDYQMDADASLVIGAEGEAATALLLGTELEPVKFSGTAAASGSWRGIALTANASAESQLSHVEIRHAGQGGDAALDLQSKITLDDVLVTESNTGVEIGAQGLSAESTELTVTATGGAPLHIAANALSSLPDCELSGNAEQHVVVEAGAISSSGTVLDLDVPYLIEGNIETGAGAKLTIEPGVEFVMADHSRFSIGADGSAASIVAEGSSDAMIVFRGETDQAGSWFGLSIDGNASAESSLQYVEIRNAGEAAEGEVGAALTLEASVEVENSVFAESPGCGILKPAEDESDYASLNTFVDVSTEVAASAEGALEPLP
ncbi:MAG TPA: hypothetical protein VHO25_17885 [Polyangiaceae bacterium]|nr:hypothetical protein [Polyangiaceae bacterium]